MSPMFIIGCGDVGSRIAAHYRAGGVSLSALVRSRSSATRLAGTGLSVRQVDLDTNERLPADTDASRLFYLVPPSLADDRDTRVRRLIDGFGQTGQPARAVYLSTTGVYGDCAGDWVDEARPARPLAAWARRRLDAERAWQGWSEATGGELVILRVAGIYGPGRLPLKRLREGLPVAAPEEAPWTNRIHVHDLVQACVAAMARGHPGAVYNVCDGHPTPMTDYFDRVADLWGLPRPPRISLAEAQARLSPVMRAYLGESRRLSNRRLRDELGVALRYSDLQSGLAACLVAESGD